MAACCSAWAAAAMSSSSLMSPKSSLPKSSESMAASFYAVGVPRRWGDALSRGRVLTANRVAYIHIPA